jgi:RNA polymerase-binding transcription factor DksA
MALEQEFRDLQHRIKAEEEQLMRLRIANPYLAEASNPDQEALIEKCSRHQRQLRVVLQGLERIRGGTFGLCAKCEKPIAEKRLEALPTAECCITCQEQAELTESAA